MMLGKVKANSILLLLLVISSWLATMAGISNRYIVEVGAVWTAVLFVSATMATADIMDCTIRNCIRIGFIVKLFLMIIDFFSGRALEYAFGIYDGAGFVLKAEAIYYGTGEYLLEEFPILINAMFRIFGLNHFVVQLIGVYVSSIAMIMVYKTLCVLKIDKLISNIIIFVLCFSPFMIMYEMAYMRESYYIFAISFSIYYFVRWIYENKWFYLMMSLVSLCPAVYLQSDGYVITFAIIAWFIVCYNYILFVLWEKKKINQVVLTAISLILLPLAARFMAAKGLDLHFIGHVYSTHVQEGGGSAYLTDMIYDDSLKEFILYSPIRIAYFFLSPMPWDFRGIKDIASFVVDSMLYLIVFVDTFRFLAHRRGVLLDNKIRQILYALIFLVFGTSILFAWGTTTAGTAIRHRKSFLVLLGLLWGIVKDKKLLSRNGKTVCQNENIRFVQPQETK